MFRVGIYFLGFRMQASQVTFYSTGDIARMTPQLRLKLNGRVISSIMQRQMLRLQKAPACSTWTLQGNSVFGLVRLVGFYSAPSKGTTLEGLS